MNHPQSKWREERRDLGMELWASPKLTDWEGDGEGWLVKYKKPTNRALCQKQGKESFQKESNQLC